MKKEYGFYQISPKSEGYILTNNRQVIVVIQNFNAKEESENRIITIGGHGAVERFCDSSEDFESGISELECFANIFVDSCYKLKNTVPFNGYLFLTG